MNLKAMLSSDEMNPVRICFRILIFTLLLLACQEVTVEHAKRSEAPAVRVRFDALPRQVKHPPDNPSTPQKIALGKLLFFDPVLSGDLDVACATCHHPEMGFSEILPISIGVNGHGFGSRRTFKQPNDIPFTKRNAQTIINTAFNGIDIFGDYDPTDAPMFWDLRVLSLESQALEPIKALEEMRGRHYGEEEILDTVVSRLRRIEEYNTLFGEVFGGPQPITARNMAKAIATYERSIVANNSRFDQYMRGDKAALSASEIEGFETFKSAGCGNCHNGPMFSDFKTHVLSVPPSAQLSEPDSGFLSTFAFRTPSLRNLRFTFPFMHNGELGSVKEILEFYEDIAGGKSRNHMLRKERLDPLVREIEIDVQQMGQIINFLLCLNDDSFDTSVPSAVPSALPVGGNIGN